MDRDTQPQAAPGILKLRHYGMGMGDHDTISGWYEDRHGQPLPEEILPPLGVVCEDPYGMAGVLFAYQSLGIGVAFLDPLISRPGFNAKQAMTVLGRCLEGIEAVLRKENYTLIRTFIPSPAMAALLVNRFGFIGRDGNLAKWLD
jgi:hypothetical protein